jgi:excinuclease ABC subunit C
MNVELAVPDGNADGTEFDLAIDAIPNKPAVFLLWPREGKPYLARTNVLKRRLQRLLGKTDKPSRMLNLRGTATRIEYSLTGSRLEAQFMLWELARQFLGPDYRKEIRLRLPPYVKLVLANRFPRTHVTTLLTAQPTAGGGRNEAVYCGPFRNRSTAAMFDSEFLDLFQLRRCQEDLEPSPQHPGCMYGEMGRCLRPCQMAVGVEEYRGEAERVAEFLRSGGKSLLDPAAAARDQLSADMDFEGAAMMHQRLGRIGNVLGLRDEMARDVEGLHAITVAPSAAQDSVELGWLRGGFWQGFTRLEFAPADGRVASLDARLRELATAAPQNRTDSIVRREQLAILSRWFYSSWRDGEMLLVDDWTKIPYRKLVNAVSRVAKGPAAAKASEPKEPAAAEPPTLHPSTHS